MRRFLPLSVLCGASLLGPGCLGSGGDEELEPAEPAPVVALENAEVRREGFRLLHPVTWVLDALDPFHDPDHNLFFQGPAGASIAVMLLDEPAPPEVLVEEMAGQHGLRRTKRSTFDRWGRYAGHGVEVRGQTAEGELSGVRVFGWSDEARSFLVTERYTEEGYQEARPGFEVLSSSFRLLGDRRTAWSDVAPGTPSDRAGELIIVRPGFRLRFPDDWTVDTGARDYDADALFTIRAPVPSSWSMIRVLDRVEDPEGFVTSARPGLSALLDEVTWQGTTDQWGLHPGAGIVLRGTRNDLEAELRIFCSTQGERSVVATEFHYTEVGPKVTPGFSLIASSFEFLR